MRGPDEWDGHGLPGGPGEQPRIPSPRPAAEDHGPLPDLPPTPFLPLTEPGPAPAALPPLDVPAEPESDTESEYESDARYEGEGDAEYERDAGFESGAEHENGAEYESDDDPAADAEAEADAVADYDPVTGGGTRPRRPPPAVSPAPSHKVLKSLLGAWALAACSPEETAAVEEHLTDCAACADEALRLRDAVGLLHPADSLDLDPRLRSRVLAGCLGRRPARIPVPEWATPYDAEAAKLDALLRDMGEAEWRAPVRLRWFDGREPVERGTTVAGVIGHLMAVDGMAATALGLPDPLGDAAPERPGPRRRTEAYWRTLGEEPDPRAPHEPWRAQSRALTRTASFTGGGAAELTVSYGKFDLALRDAFLDRAFETWVHAGDIAEAVDYPYKPPGAAHLHLLVDFAARLLPGMLARRRQAGLAAPPQRLVAAGAPGRSLHLEIEGNGGGDWYIPLDSPAAVGSREFTVAHLALDSDEFCQLAAGHLSPEETAVGQNGEREAVREVLLATASLSRL